jgi:hypothetical protein
MAVQQQERIALAAATHPKANAIAHHVEGFE